MTEATTSPRPRPAAMPALSHQAMGQRHDPRWRSPRRRRAQHDTDADGAHGAQEIDAENAAELVWGPAGPPGGRGCRVLCWRWRSWTLGAWWRRRSSPPCRRDWCHGNSEASPREERRDAATDDGHQAVVG